MPNIIEITDFAAPGLDVYARLTEAQLRNRREREKGLFIAKLFFASNNPLQKQRFSHK